MTPLLVTRRLAPFIMTANLVMIVQRPALSYEYIYHYYGKTYQDSWNEAFWWMVAFVSVNAILLTSWYHYRSVMNNNNNGRLLAPRTGNVSTLVWNEAKPTVVWISLFLFVPAVCHSLDSIDGAIPMLFLCLFCLCMIPIGIVLWFALTRCWSLSTGFQLSGTRLFARTGQCTRGHGRCTGATRGGTNTCRQNGKDDQRLCNFLSFILSCCC